jgi:hypothetical protein
MLGIEFKFNKYEEKIKVENLSRFRIHKPAEFQFLTRRLATNQTSNFSFIGSPQYKTISNNLDCST